MTGRAASRRVHRGKRLAVDGAGNMAVGYSESSPSTFPAIRYAGRLYADPPGELPVAETSIVEGTGAQTISNRWGDYSAMVVDPVDDCTFWYTSQYYAVTGTSWRTRIASFKFPHCGDNPVPATNAMQPSSAVIGSGALTLAVFGTGFVPASLVRWNGAVRPTTYVSDTELHAAISAADVATTGSAAVTVFNPVPGGGASNTQTFAIVKAPATLILGALVFTYDGTPKPVTVTTTPAGISGVSVTYDGAATPPTNAGSYAVVASLTSDHYAATPASATLVIRKATATLTLGTLTFTYDGTAKPVAVTTSPAGLAGVSVTYNGASAPPTAAGVYAVVASLAHPDYQAAQATGTLTINNPTPVVTTVLPAQIVAGGDSFSLRLLGSNFVAGAIVSWNGSPRTTTFVSATELGAGINAADVATAGTASVVVQNPFPAVAASRPVTLTINNPVPLLRAVSPPRVPSGHATFTLAVEGTHFVAGAIVLWNGFPRPTTMPEAGRLVATIAAADVAVPGTALVTVLNPAPPTDGAAGASGSHPPPSSGRGVFVLLPVWR